jgi:IMP dehydrogenase
MWTYEYKQNQKICFNDILLVPQYSTLSSRTIPDISTQIGFLKLKVPIISAPMDTITGHEMLATMDRCSGLGILTRYINMPDDKELVKQVDEIKLAIAMGAKNIGCAIGIRGNTLKKAKTLLDNGCNVICIDVAHGDHAKMYDAISRVVSLKDQYKFVLMAGNVCTPKAAFTFASCGVDAIKVGIGPGAACTTRIITGFGCPQMSAILDCASCVKEEYPDVAIIADGGIRSSGDMVKSLWGGADACMIGYMLAGTSDTPKINGNRIYRGMSSRMASERPDIAPEGISMEVDDKGSTEYMISECANGIKSGLAMGGSENIAQLREKVSCIIVSPLSMDETLPRRK